MLFPRTPFRPGRGSMEACRVADVPGVDGVRNGAVGHGVLFFGDTGRNRHEVLTESLRQVKPFL